MGMNDSGAHSAFSIRGKIIPSNIRKLKLDKSCSFFWYEERQQGRLWAHEELSKFFFYITLFKEMEKGGHLFPERNVPSFSEACSSLCKFLFFFEWCLDTKSFLLTFLHILLYEFDCTHSFYSKVLLDFQKPGKKCFQ